MYVHYVFAILVVLGTSLLISIKCGPPRNGENWFEYLFGHNDRFLATSSNTGSFFSISFVFTMYTVGIINYGLWALVSTIISIAIAYSVLIFMSIRYHNLYSNPSPDRSSLILDNHPHAKYSPVVSFIVIIQYVLLLYLEILTFYLFITHISTNLSDLTHSSIVHNNAYSLVNSIPSILILIVISFLCALYVHIGGYHGVLKTDLFQYIIIIMAFALTVFYNHDSILSYNYLHVLKNGFPPVHIVGFITYTIFMALGMAFLPDVWVRNISSLGIGKKHPSIHFILSAVMLVTSLMAFSLMCIDDIVYGKYSLTYDVPGIIDKFSFDFANIIYQGDSSAWIIFLIAAFICAFITTIDTFLITLVQHSFRYNRRSCMTRLTLIPFIIIPIAILAIFSPAQAILVVGLAWFPILPINAILALSEFSKNIKRMSSRQILIIFSIGESTNIFLEWYHWGRLSNAAPYIIFIPYVLMFVSFISMYYYTQYRRGACN